MDALLLSFVAAALAEWGDKTQLLVVALAVRYRQPMPILAGVAFAALANAALAAFGGTFVHDMITLRALSLLVALALIYAAVASFVRQKQPDLGSGSNSGAFLTTLVGFFLLEFGDKTQFLTFAVAAQYDSLVLAAAGATAGVIGVSAPSALLGEKLAPVLPLKGIRIAVASIFLIVGAVVAINAWRLV
jgi:Ca2+/H+ antiporter, TMEM165/GDT1 family